MNISELKTHLATVATVDFRLPNGNLIPAHFHVTELGLISKQSIDCGGQSHSEQWAVLQLWVANDTEHRLTTKGFASILTLTEPILQGQDLEIEVEYQHESISKFGLDFANGEFVLRNKYTDCRAKELCAVPQKQKISLLDLAVVSNSCCTPNTNCCG